MQTITLIALGKLNADYYAKAAAEYAKRLSAYCRLNIVELPEEPIAEKNASPAVIGKALEKEAPTGSASSGAFILPMQNSRTATPSRARMHFPKVFIEGFILSF